MIAALMLHYVKDSRSVNFGNLPYFDRERLLNGLQQLENMSALASMDQFKGELKSNFDTASSKVILTFDDGYTDHYDTYFEIKKRFDVAMMFFVAADPLEKRNLLVNRIQIFLGLLDQSKTEVVLEVLCNEVLCRELLSKEDLAEIKVAVGKLRTYDSTVVIMIKRLLQKYIKHDDANDLMDLLEDSFLPIQLRAKASEYWNHLYMDRDQCSELHSNGARIGYHTRSHPHLDSLDPKDLRSEITMPNEGFLNKCFCYPYGSVNEECKAVVRQSGYEFAFGTQHGICQPGSDFFQLPRIDINSLEDVIETVSNDVFFKKEN